MSDIFRPLAAALAALAWLVVSPAAGQTPAQPRYITPQDVVELEAFGRATFSPDGRWAVYEKRGPYNSASRFDYGIRAASTIMDLWLVDVSDPASIPAPLLPGEGPGLQRMAWSPDGRSLLISRLRNDTLEVGIVTLETRRVQWTGLTPETPRTGATAEWVSADTFILSVRPDGSLPEAYTFESGTQARMTEAWRRSAEGREPARTVIDADGGRAVAGQPTPPGTLLLVNAKTGSRRTLSGDRTVDFAVSPDGASIAVVSAGEPAPLATSRVTQLESADRQRLSLIRLSDGSAARPVPDRDIGSGLLRWSPDSTAVLVWARRDGAEWAEGELIAARAGGAEALDLGDLTAGSTDEVVRLVRADWLGGAPVVYARPKAGVRYDWYRLAPGAQPRNLTGALSVAPGRLAAWSPDGLMAFADGALWAVAEGGVRRLSPENLAVQAATDSDAEQTRRLGLNEASRRDWAAATGPAGESVVYSCSAATSLGQGSGTAPRILGVSRNAALVLERQGLEETLWLRSVSGQRSLDAVNSSKRDIVLIQPQPIRHVGFDGRETTSWLFLPGDRPAGAMRGVVVNVYPGDADHLVWNDPLTMTYAIRPGVVAAAGFAVLSASIPGNLAVEERGDQYARAADLAVDAALAAHPVLPANKLAVFGHSFGGYATMEIATRSTRYRSFIASSGPYDFMGAWGLMHAATRVQPEDGLRFRQVQGLVETGQGRMGEPPWKVPELYLGSSPFLRAGNIQAPVLLLTADLDFIAMQNAEMMFSALHREGKRARLVTYWGEKHHVWSPANITDKYREIFDWLDDTLAEPARHGTPEAPQTP